MPPSLSVVIIARNEAANIRDCLASVAFADEIIVVDSESTDATAAICREAGARVIVQPFVGFGQQKNAGIVRATGDWILNLDADERVTEGLRDEIQAVIAAPEPADGYWIARQNFFGDRWVRHGGWWPDYTLRLFRRGKGRYNEHPVHAAVQLDGTAGKLRQPMRHYTCRDFAAFSDRQMRYAETIARELHREGRRAGPLDVALRPAFTFFKMYVLRAGFLDGTVGWQLARLYARYNRRKYAQLRSFDRHASAGTPPSRSSA